MVYNTKGKRLVHKRGLNVSFRDYDWEGLAESCQDEMDLAVESAQEELDRQYAKFIAGKEREWQEMNPEAGSYEGNWEDAHPKPKLKNVFVIKRKAADAAVVDFIERNFIKDNAMVIMPQIIEYISSFKLSTISGEDFDPKLDEKISAIRLYKAYFLNNKFNLGLYHFLMLDKRSSYLETQYKAPARNYCMLVPLIPYAFKLKHGVTYSAWDEAELEGVVSPSLYEAMTYRVDPAFTTEELLLARSTGLRVKSGTKEGEMRNPLYTYKLYAAEGMKGIPDLTQTMLTQIWVAHPNNRTKYMVLDPDNWDQMPEPLVTTEVIGNDKPVEYKFDKVQETNDVDVPW